MQTTLRQLRPGWLRGVIGAVDGQGMDYTPGVRSAELLFDRGLPFEAVVRGLRTQIGMSDDQATRAATAAAAQRATCA